MDPTDFADVTGSTFTFLTNGLSPTGNWTALFRPGERVRLRFINAAAMTFYDVRVPGLTMTVVQADGQNVQSVAVEEFRFGPAETYDVIVQPNDDQAYTIFCRSHGQERLCAWDACSPVRHGRGDPRAPYPSASNDGRHGNG
jgi:FtsP/CotA-like multicopper oxidase with cupredoxin domain